MMRGNGQPRRVVITGMGVVSPLGSDVETFWKRLIAGESGIGPVTRFDTSKYDTRFAAEVQGYRTEEYMDRKDIRRTDLFVQYAIGAAAGCAAAGVSPETVDAKRYGVVTACGIGGIATFEDQYRTLLEKDPRVSPLHPDDDLDMASGQVSITSAPRVPTTAVSARQGRTR
jgi:3-oxoacyl-(acyl-carrier-protein) synthase